MEGFKIRILLAVKHPERSAFWEEVLRHIQDDSLEFQQVSQIPNLRSKPAGQLSELIVLDLVNSGEAGFQDFLDLRAKVLDVPVVVVTAKDRVHLALKLVQAGAGDCVTPEGKNVTSLGLALQGAIWRQVHLGQLRFLSEIAQKAGRSNPEEKATLAEEMKKASMSAKASLAAFRMAFLEKTRDTLADNPLDLEALYYRARLLEEMGRGDEAEPAYAEILNQDPNHWKAPEEPSLLWAAYAESVKRNPNHVMGHVRLAGLLAAKGDLVEARREHQKALALEPDCVTAREGMTGLEPEKDGEGYDLSTRPRDGGSSPILPVILLMTAADANAPFQSYFDPRRFRVIPQVMEYFNPSRPLQPHRLVVNAVADADLCRLALENASLLVSRTEAAVVNRPDSVMGTGRINNAARFSRIPGVVAPAIVQMNRKELAQPGGFRKLAECGFSFPLLLRSPGFHTGRHFQKVDDERGLAVVAASLPGETLMAIRYLEGRRPDGKNRKYRVMVIGGRLLPAHLAVSGDWKVHYFSSEMADRVEYRAEEEVFLDDMERVLGPTAFRALEEIGGQLALDYAGVDFALDKEGRLLLFEANPYMVVYPPGPETFWNYRRTPVARIHEAVRRMFSEKILEPKR